MLILLQLLAGAPQDLAAMQSFSPDTAMFLLNTETHSLHGAYWPDGAGRLWGHEAVGPWAVGLGCGAGLWGWALRLFAAV